MDNEKIIFEEGAHKCVMFSFDDESHEDSYLSVNQFLIVQNGDAILIDPGSEAVFDEMLDAVSRHVEIDKIKFVFFSHQDPDVSGSIAQWSIATNAKFITSALWVRFMSHYGFSDMSRIMALPDKGAKLNFGDQYIKFIPSHFLHSPGNFSVYDSRSKILFSGDIGAAVVASVSGVKEVNSFEEHRPHLEGFHKRYMASNKVCRKWVELVRKYPVDIIAPQHGYLFHDKNVEEFLNWFENLECGFDNIDLIF